MHCPAVVHSRCLGVIDNSPATDTPHRSLGPKVQQFVVLKPIDSLDVRVPTFPSEQNMQPPIAVVNAGRSEFFQKDSARCLLIPDELELMKQGSEISGTGLRSEALLFSRQLAQTNGDGQ